MILRLEIENLSSIRDRFEVDFTLPKTTPEDGRYLTVSEEHQIRVPATIAIIGANASGKTSALRALAFVPEFVRRSFGNYRPDDHIMVDPFHTDKCRKKISRIAIEFASQDEEFLGLVFKYELHVQQSEDKNYVALERFSEAKIGEKYREVFLLERPTGDAVKIRASKEFNLRKGDPRRSVRQNVSLVSSLIQFGHEPSERIERLFSSSFISNLALTKFKYPEETVNKLFYENDGLLEELNKAIRVVDVGIERVAMQKADGVPYPVFYHKGLDGVQTLPFESEGTKSFYLFFPVLVYALNSGAVATIDELDSDLHPSLLNEILRWFRDPFFNVRKGQLIFSANSPSILHEAEKEEIWIVEKGPDGASQILPLGEMSGLRRDANLYAKYLGGALGGMPRFG